MYHVLTKEEKKSLKERYRGSKRGQSMFPRLNRLVLEGLFLIIFPIALVIVGFVTNEIYWWIWTLSIICLIIGIVFLVDYFMTIGIWQLLVEILIGVISYGIMLIITRDEIIISFITKVFHKKNKMN